MNRTPRAPLKCDDCGGRLERDGRCRSCDPSVFAAQLEPAAAARYLAMHAVKRADMTHYRANIRLREFDAATASPAVAVASPAAGAPKACPTCGKPMASEQAKRCWICRPPQGPPRPSAAMKAYVDRCVKSHQSKKKGGGS